MGGNFWYLCETQEAVLEGGKRALDAIQSVTGAIAPFDIDVYKRQVWYLCS